MSFSVFAKQVKKAEALAAIAKSHEGGHMADYVKAALEGSVNAQGSEYVSINAHGSTSTSDGQVSGQSFSSTVTADAAPEAVIPAADEAGAASV